MLAFRLLTVIIRFIMHTPTTPTTEHLVGNFDRLTAQNTDTDFEAIMANPSVDTIPKELVEQYLLDRQADLVDAREALKILTDDIRDRIGVIDEALKEALDEAETRKEKKAAKEAAKIALQGIIDEIEPEPSRSGCSLSAY